jgi:tetratricopeptide (TPR) repeat protein
MYTRRFANWGLSKNLVKSDMSVSSRESNLANRKNPINRAGNQDMSMDDIVRSFTWKEKGRWTRDSDTSTGSTPPRWTPSPTIPASLSPPGVLLVSENLFTSISIYASCYLCRGMCSKTPKGDYSAITSDGTVIVDSCEDLWVYLCLAAQFAKCRSPVEFRRVLSKAFGLVREIITAQHPRTLNTIFLILHMLTQNGLFDVRAVFCRYLGEMAKAVVVRNHPWGNICRLVALFDTEAFDESLVQYWRCTIDAYERSLGLSNPFAVEAKSDFTWNVYGSTDLPKAEKLLREILASVEDTAVSINLIENLNLQGRSEEVQQLASDLLSSLGPDEVLNKAGILSKIATSYYNQGNKASAEKYIREAIALLLSDISSPHTWTFHWIERLGRWLREWGRDEEADQLESKGNVMIGTDEIDEELGCAEQIGKYPGS